MRTTTWLTQEAKNFKLSRNRSKKKLISYGHLQRALIPNPVLRWSYAAGTRTRWCIVVPDGQCVSAKRGGCREGTSTSSAMFYRSRPTHGWVQTPFMFSVSYCHLSPTWRKEIGSRRLTLMIFLENRLVMVTYITE